ncbi:MAG: ribosome small subunit-dependent GTPase A [Bacteroidetes bacterium]|nr:ribosome small subunit-dependent GTPase A [Bacteroidota bacterium]
MEGLVIKSTGSRITVRLDDGRVQDCRLKGQFRIKDIKHTNPVAIGDRVVLEINVQHGDGLITKIHPRENYIIRKATKLSKVSHIIAANLDHAYLIVTLAEPRTSTGFIDRFLVTAAGYYIPASLVFNKTDLYSPELRRLYKELRDIYERAGYPCYAVSALKGTNLKNLKSVLKGKINLFAGHSGAGKSALINAIQPGLDIRTGKISGVHLKGIHTTTFAEMHELSGGGFIVDTPGIREFGLIHFEQSEIPRCFPEMEKFLPYCQYKNCTHTHEPGCAVKNALGSGAVSHMRYNSYLSILNDS